MSQLSWSGKYSEAACSKYGLLNCVWRVPTSQSVCCLSRNAPALVCFLVSDFLVLVSDSRFLVSDSRDFGFWFAGVWFLIRGILVSDSQFLVSDSRLLVSDSLFLIRGKFLIRGLFLNLVHHMLNEGMDMLSNLLYDMQVIYIYMLNLYYIYIYVVNCCAFCKSPTSDRIHPNPWSKLCTSTATALATRRIGASDAN